MRVQIHALVNHDNQSGKEVYENFLVFREILYIGSEIKRFLVHIL